MRPIGFGMTGALLAVRRQILQRLGGLSTAYATAYEDVDYCLHAWANDVRVFYCGAAAAYHHEGGTRGNTAEEKGARPLAWTERERAGQQYFRTKWAVLRHVESFQMVSALLRRGHVRQESASAGSAAAAQNLHEVLT